MQKEKNKIGVLVFGSVNLKFGVVPRFFEEIKKHSYHPEIFYGNLFSVFYKKNKLEIYYNNKKIDVKKFLFFIPSYGMLEKEIISKISITKFLRGKGVKILNSPEAAFLAKNKRDSLFLLSQNGLPVIPTGINYDHNFLDKQLLKNKKNKFVAKLNVGSKGGSVSSLDSKISFISFIEFISNIGCSTPNILIQPFINSNSEDYRIVVTGNKVVAGMKRKAKGIEFRANIAKGGLGKNIKPNKQMIDLSIKATKILGLDYAGVDIIKDKKGKLMIIEVNSNPGMIIEEITGINVAGEIINHCIKKAEAK